MAAPGGETSQTLDRGLTVLKLLAKSQDGLTVADIADQLGTARPIVYRLLRTLESHNLVSREDLRYLLGFGIAELAGSIRPRLQATVLPILRSLSKLTGSTALLSVADGEHALILLTAEPQDAALHLVMREGARHPLTVGADGIAILAGRPAAPGDTDDIRMARHRGYAVTVGAIQPGAVGVAAPIRVSDWATASLGVVQLGVEISDEVSEAVAPAVISAAHEAATRLSGGVSGKAVNQLPRSAAALGRWGRWLQAGRVLGRPKRARTPGVDLLTLAPGPVRTEGAASAEGIDFGKLPVSAMQPAPVIRAALHALGRKALVIPGVLNKASGFAGKYLTPRRAQTAMYGALVSRALHERPRRGR